MSEQKDRPELMKELVEAAEKYTWEELIPLRNLLRENEPEQKDRKLRDLLWATHACSGKYCDDGELQCGYFLPTIDFLRDKPKDIEAKIPLHNAQLLQQKSQDRPELRIVETNPYWDTPDSACEGIYEAGKEAQLEADRKALALFPDIEAVRKQAADTIKGIVKMYEEDEANTIEEAKREERERMVKDIHSIEFESNSATDFLNKTLNYIKALKGD